MNVIQSRSWCAWMLAAVAVIGCTSTVSPATVSPASPSPSSTVTLPPSTVAPTHLATLPIATASGAVLGSWEAAANMHVARKRHTATLLSDGRVLVAGGVDSNDDATTRALASAELYDPKSGKWTATGDMVHPRAWHTATLLPNGLVLVAGGQCPGPATKGCPAISDPSGAIAESELYDPKTGRWAAAGNMTSPRFQHSATLLTDGEVLVSGAELAPDSILASTELYDPTTRKWTAVGDMRTARWQHFAVGLPDGSAIVAGGYGSSGLLSSVELFDPASIAWVSAPPLLVGRAQGGASAVLARGSVLLAGGDGGGDRMLASAELYSASGGSTATGSMSTTRAEFSSALLSGSRLFVVGGFDVPGTGKLLSSAEIYDPEAGGWSGAGDMATARFEFRATLLADGRVLITGGAGADSVWSSAEIYSP